MPRLPVSFVCGLDPRYLKKKKETQKTASLPQEFCGSCPAISHVVVDLAEPFKVYTLLKKRSTRRSEGTLKVWGACQILDQARALKIYLAPGYSTDDFMVAWVDFESDCGISKKVHIDRGLQLAVLLGGLMCQSTIGTRLDHLEKDRLNGVVLLVPNGAVEAMVKQFKMSIELHKHWMG